MILQQVFHKFVCSNFIITKLIWILQGELCYWEERELFFHLIKQAKLQPIVFSSLFLLRYFSTYKYVKDHTMHEYCEPIIQYKSHTLYYAGT